MMTPEQAVQLLDLAASAAQGNRADHVQFQQATKVLQEFIADVRAKYIKPEDKPRE